MSAIREGMNWSAVQFDWNQVRAFLATAEEGSLSAAARALETTQPTIGRQVSALEETLGVALFERVGRGLVLTPTGAAVLAEVRAMGDAAARVSLVAAAQNDAVAGRVAISVSDMMAIHFAPDFLAHVQKTAPDLEIELIVTNDMSDLLKREADIALRHARPTEPELIGREIRNAHAAFFASQDFVARHGAPRRLGDAQDLPFIGFAPPETMLSELAKRGVALPEGSIRLYSRTIFAAWELVVAGLGIGIMSKDIAARSPGIVPILEDEPDMPVELWLVTHRELRMSRRIRLVWDMLVEHLNRA